MRFFLEVLVAIGGSSLIWVAAKNGIPQAVAFGFRWLLTKPAIKAAVAAHKDDIKAIIAETEKDVDAEIDKT